MSGRRKRANPEMDTTPRVEPLDYIPQVGQVRHLTLTLPNSSYSYGYTRKIDTTVTLTADEADDLATKLRDAAHKLRGAA